MDSDSENETQNDKTFTDLTNCTYESMDNSNLQFETFFIAENEDSEEDCFQEDNAVIEANYSDDSKESSEVDICNIENALNMSQNFSLMSEDWRTINSSQNLELAHVMTMNRNEKFVLLQLFHKIKGFLVDIQNQIKPLQKLFESNESKECPVMLLGQMGAPYFKTKKHMFSNDPNPDTLDRKKKGLISNYQTVISSKWSKNECDYLTRGVKLTYNHNKQKSLYNEIDVIKRRLHNEEDSKMISSSHDKIELLEAEIRNLKAIGMNDIPPLAEDKFIDWDHISTEYLMDKHNAQDCSAFWHIYLHPDINKSNWSSEENKQINELAEKYNKQDWDQIAVELGTNRSGFTVFLHYSSVLCAQLPKSRFTEEEDRILLQHIENRKIGSYIPWNTIAELFTNRSKLQLIHRYKYFLTNVHQYTQEFTDAEDILILILVERFGRNYIKFTKYVPCKSYMQIKCRYENHLRIPRKMGCFTLEEDEQIMKHFSNVNTKIGPLTFLLKRSRHQLRQRYKILKQFFNKHPELPLANVPRRMCKKDNSRRLEFLKCIVNQFKGSVEVPCIDEIELKLGKRKKSKNLDIDTLLVNFFSTSYTIKQKPFEVSSTKVKNAAETIYIILQLWGVKIQIPAEMRKSTVLDIVDVEILNFLRDKYYSYIPKPFINDLLPPNMNSLIGLRGLLLKNLSRSETSKSQRVKKAKMNLTLKDKLNDTGNNRDTPVDSEHENIFNNKNSNTQSMAKSGESLFLYRFISMFMWPGLLSIESPNKKILKKELGLKNSEHCKMMKNKEDKCKDKSIKRKCDEIHNNPAAKKKRLILNDKKQTTKSIHSEREQQTRYSLRVRNRNQISEKNETIVSDQKFQDVETPQDENRDNETTMEHMNSKEQVQIIGVDELTNLKTSKIPKINLNESGLQMVPSNLIKVHKSEIVKLLQNKKPVKIFKIQSIKKQDGSMFNITKPSNIKISERMEKVENLKRLGASGLVALADNIRNNTEAHCGYSSQNVNKQNNVLMDLNKMKSTLKNSIRNNSGSGTFLDRKKLILGNNIKSQNELSQHKIECDITEDIPSNGEDEDSIIDLTENEVMMNEVEQLDLLIKQESALGLT